MEYDFSKRGRGFGKIVFALTLDRKKMTERIVIGEMNETRRQLEDGSGNIYFDHTRPLGQLLIDFETDTGMEWNRYAMTLRESYGKAIPLEAARWKMAAPVADFLRDKYENGEPSALFAAVKTWDEYLNCFNFSHGADMLMRRMSALYRPFFLYDENNRPWQEEATAALSKVLRDEEAAVELWYPVLKRSFECVVASASFLPVIAYYLHKIDEWGFVFQGCKVCGKDFLARSRHYELCSDECRKVQAVEAKREFDERAKTDKAEQYYEAAYYYWYNRLRKLKRGKTADTEKAAMVSAAFKVFRKEAVRLKRRVKDKEMPITEFSSWLVQQQGEVDRLMES
ncbi:hypothetical protein LJC63_00005 [Ruminococcaceae bacterium OttesenSCG-928-L11]|nr:hypothetical protein [Ruminococcaceae bacterium OttesenSCG-928-L11]